MPGDPELFVFIPDVWMMDDIAFSGLKIDSAAPDDAVDFLSALRLTSGRSALSPKIPKAAIRSASAQLVQT